MYKSMNMQIESGEEVPGGSRLRQMQSIQSRLEYYFRNLTLNNPTLCIKSFFLTLAFHSRRRNSHPLNHFHCLINQTTPLAIIP